jgi:transposase InsO family protein
LGVQSIGKRRIENGTEPPLLNGVKKKKPTSLRDLGTSYRQAFVTFIDVLWFRQIVSDKKPEEINIVLWAHNILTHRQASKPATSMRPKEHVATGPNQVWSWDITYLKTPVRGLFFYL